MLIGCISMHRRALAENRPASEIDLVLDALRTR